MKAPLPGWERVLWSLTVALLVAGPVAVLTHGGTSSQASPASTRRSPVASLVPVATPGALLPVTPSSLPPLPSSTAPSPTTVTTAAPTTTVAPIVVPAPGQPAAPGPVNPTRPGGYLYRETVHSSRGDSTTTLDERVANETSPTGELRQSVTDTTSDNSANSHQEVSWMTSGLFLRAEDLSFGGTSFSCALNPPVQELAYPLAVGKQWTLRGSCQISVAGQPVTVTLRGTARVTGTERVLVAGQAVDVWVIQSDLDVTGSGAFNFTGHQVATRRLAPRQGLVVTESSTTSASLGQGAPMVVTESRQLQSLQPS